MKAGPPKVGFINGAIPKAKFATPVKPAAAPPPKNMGIRPVRVQAPRRSPWNKPIA